MEQCSNYLFSIAMQIDRTYPDVNLTINEELLDAGVLAVDLRKTDIGSGVREVDLYQVMPGMISYSIVILLAQFNSLLLLSN